MKKIRMIVVFLLVIFAAAAVLMSGCRQSPDAEASKSSPVENDRFITVYSKAPNGVSSFKIFEDVYSGVLYVYYQQGYGGGLSVLYNADGTVMTAR